LTEEYEELLRLHPPETFEPGALGPEERAA
jgi:hypothetical protein